MRPRAVPSQALLVSQVLMQLIVVEPLMLLQSRSPSRPTTTVLSCTL